MKNNTLKTKLTIKPLLTLFKSNLKQSIQKILKVKPRQLHSFKTKTGKIIKTFKKTYILSLNFNKHFQKIVKPVHFNVFSNYFNFFQKAYLNKLRHYRKTTKLLKKRFLYKFYIKKYLFIKQLFIRTLFLFGQQLQQSLYLINTFPRFLLKHFPLKITKKNIQQFITIFAHRSFDFFTIENLEKLKLDFVIFLKKYLTKLRAYSYIKNFLNNQLFFTLINKSIDKLVKKKKSKRRILFNFKKWLTKYQNFLKLKYYNSLTVKLRKQQEYANNYRLLKIKFKNNLSTFVAYKKAQDRLKIINNKIRFMRTSSIIYRLKYFYLKTKQSILRNTSLIPFNNLLRKNYISSLKKHFVSLSYFKVNLIKSLALIKNIKPDNLDTCYKVNHINLKLSFISKRLLNIFTNAIYHIKNNVQYKLTTTLNKFNAYLLAINNKFKKFALNKLKRNIAITKKLPISSNLVTNNRTNLHILRNKTILVQARFKKYMNQNLLYNKFNLLQNLEVTNLLKNTSDILRAEHFRNLLNKEDAYYQTFYKQQKPLQLLTTITGHNIYLTLFASKPYKILWKASAGMLGLKHFRRAKKQQLTFKDLIIRCQLFLAKNRILLQRPLHLRLRYLNYFGTKNFLSFFVSQKKSKNTFDHYKNLKIYNFYKNAPHLSNNYSLQFMSMMWSRTRNSFFKLRKKIFYNLVNKTKTELKAFPHLLKQKTPTTSFIVLNNDKRLIKFLNTNPFIIK